VRRGAAEYHEAGGVELKGRLCTLAKEEGQCPQPSERVIAPDPLGFGASSIGYADGREKRVAKPEAGQPHRYLNVVLPSKKMAQVPSFDCATRSNPTETKTRAPGFIRSLASAPLFRYWFRLIYNGISFVSVHNCSVVTNICCLAENRAHNRSTSRVNRPTTREVFFSRPSTG
jgi:hypothetical protein